MKKLKRFLRSLGPGFITGSADDDPSGVVTYSQAGAQFGYGQLWSMLFTIPFMIVVQETSARIGMVTGKGLAGVIREHYSRWILAGAVFLLFLANTVNIGADLGAMAAAAQLYINAPFVLLLLIFTVFTIYLEIFIPYPTYARYLKYLTVTLLAYVFVAFMTKQDWSQVFYSLTWPHVEWSKSYILMLLAVLGTTISPYLFFWQADEEVEEEVERGIIPAMGEGTPHVTKRDMQNLRRDTTIGMLYSNIVAFFIIIAAAATLGRHGITEITTAAQAAEALEPVAGHFASALFAIGIIGSGLLAVPILAGSASYAVAESMGWKEGLSLKWGEAKRFYSVIAVSTLIGLLVNVFHLSPMRMLVYSAALNAALTPPLLIIILLVATNKKIMGAYTISRTSAVWMTVLTALLFGVFASFFLL